MLSSVTPKFARSRGLRFTTAVVAGLFVLFFAQGAAAATDAGTSRSLVNSTRSGHGLGTLQANGGLDTLARAQAQRMVARDAISHNPKLQSDADAQGVSWTLIGENVGVGPDVETVHQAFMASPGHKANVIHGDYNQIGVGTAIGTDGSVFVAHVFARVEGAAQAAKPATAAPAQPTAATSAPATLAPATSAPATSAPAASTAAPALESQPVNTAPADPTTPNALVGGIVNA